MSSLVSGIALVVWTCAGFFLAYGRAYQLRMLQVRMHSGAFYHGVVGALIALVTIAGLQGADAIVFSTALGRLCQAWDPLSVRFLAYGALGMLLCWLNVRGHLRVRVWVERAMLVLLVAASIIAVLIGVAIVVSILFESVQFFRKVPLSDFLFGTYWNPLAADSTMRPEEFNRCFGALPLFTGSLLITLIAMATAIPMGIASAIFLRFYATDQQRSLLKPVLELLSGIPTVIYGFLALSVLGPALRQVLLWLGVDMGSESAMVAGVVMGVMILPLISSVTDDIFAGQSATLREGALALGATLSETIKGVLLPAAMPGVLNGILLALSRAIGETMLVVMAAGLSANLTMNPLESVTTVTVQIVSLLSGDQTFSSPATLAAFALGLVLFFITLAINMIAAFISRRLTSRMA